MKWAAASSGLTLIKTASFSNVANTGTTFDDVFSSTYTNYQILYDVASTTAADNLHLQLRYAGPTTQTSTYFWQRDDVEGATPTSTYSRNTADSQFDLSIYNGDTPYSVKGVINIFKAGVDYRTSFTHHGFNGNYDYGVFGQGYQYTSRIYTGFLFKSSSSNITGTVSVYGLAK